MAENPLQKSVDKFIREQNSGGQEVTPVRSNPFLDSVQKFVAEKETAAHLEANPEEDTRSPLRKGIGLLGSGASKAFEILDIPVEKVGYPTIGYISQQAAKRGLLRTSDEPGENRSILGVDIPGTGATMTPEQAERIANADSAREAFDIRMENESGASQFATRMGADPLNLVGAGLARSALQGARAGATTQAARTFAPTTRIGRAADFVADADALIGQGLALPITVPFRAARNVLGRTGLLKPSESGARLLEGRFAGSLDEEQVLRSREDWMGHRRVEPIRQRLFRQAQTDDAGNTVQRFGLTDEAETLIRNNEINPNDLTRILETNPLEGETLLGNERVRAYLRDQRIINSSNEVTNYARTNEQIYSALTSVSADEQTIRSTMAAVNLADEAIPSIARSFGETADARYFDRPGKLYEGMRVTSNLEENTRFYIHRGKDGMDTTVLNIGADANPETVNQAILGGLFTELGGSTNDYATLYRSMGTTSAAAKRAPRAIGASIVDFLRTHEFGIPELNNYANVLRESLAGLPLSGARPLGQAGKEVVAARLGGGYLNDTRNAQHLFRQGGYARSRHELMGRLGQAITERGQEAQRRAGMPRSTFSPTTEPLPAVDRTRWLNTLPDDAHFGAYFKRLTEVENIPAAEARAVQQMLNPFINQNGAHFRAGILIENHGFQDNLVRAMKDPANRTVHLAQAMEAINLEQYARHIRNPIFGWFDRVTDVGRRMGMPHESGRFGRVTDLMLKQDRAKMKQMVNNTANEELQGLLTRWGQAARQVDTAIDRIRREVPVSGLDKDTTWQIISDNPRIKKLFTREELNSLQTSLELIQGPRGSAARAESFRKELARAWMDDMGIAQNPNYKKTVQRRKKQDAQFREGGSQELRASSWKEAAEWVTQAWREQALLSVRYHVTNGLDMIVKSAIHGIHMNPVGVRDSAQKSATTWGMQYMPVSLRDAVVRDSSMIAQAQMPNTPTRLSWLASRLGAPAAVSDNIAKIINKNREIALLMETSARAAAWKTTVERHLTRALPRFQSQLRNELTASGMDGAQVRAVMDQLDGHVMYSPDQLHQWLTRSGANQSLATRYSQQWDALLREGSQRGEEMALKVHFDFAAETQLEAMTRIRHLLPFHVWATRNIPFYLQTMAQNPWTMRVYRRWNEASEAEQEQLGLTPRFREKIMVPDLGPGNAVVSLLLGPGFHAYNPMVGMSIYDQIKEPYIPDPDEESAVTYLGYGLSQGRRVGFSLAPWFDLPLNALGVYGQQEPFGIWRHGDVLTGGIDRRSVALTGQLPGALVGKEHLGLQDIRPTSRLVQGFRNYVPWTRQTHTITGSQRMDGEINRRIREMAVEETGDGQHPLYTVAMVDPESEIYLRASHEVRRQMLERNAESFMHPLPRATMRETELEARRTAPNVEFGSMPPHVISYLSDQKHPSTHLWRAPRDTKQAQINAGWAIWRERSVPEEQRWKIIDDLGLHWFQDFWAWRNAQPDGADTSTEAYLNTVR